MGSDTLRFLTPALMIVLLTNFAPALDLLETTFYATATEVNTVAWLATSVGRIAIGVAIVVAFAILCIGLHQ